MVIGGRSFDTLWLSLMAAQEPHSVVGGRWSVVRSRLSVIGGRWQKVKSRLFLPLTDNCLPLTEMVVGKKELKFEIKIYI
jgi:hypothetical protein